MLYKLALGLLATAVVGEELAAPLRRRDIMYYPVANFYLVNADAKSWKDKEGNTIDLSDLKKKDLIDLDKGVMKKLMKVKKKMKKIKKKCERRRTLQAAAEGISGISKAEGLTLLSKAEGEGSSKKKGKKKKYKKMTKDELIELVGKSAMDMEKAKKKIAKLKKKCA